MERKKLYYAAFINDELFVEEATVFREADYWIVESINPHVTWNFYVGQTLSDLGIGVTYSESAHDAVVKLRVAACTWAPEGDIRLLRTRASQLAKAVEGPITSMISATALQLHPACTVSGNAVLVVLGKLSRRSR